MTTPSSIIVPQRALAINEMIQEMMSLSNNERKEEMTHFLMSSRNIQNEIMATVLRGLIVKASA